MQQCQHKSENIKQLLVLAYINPDHFVFALMNQPGYMAMATCELVHIVKFTAVNVTFRLFSRTTGDPQRVNIFPYSKFTLISSTRGRSYVFASRPDGL